MIQVMIGKTDRLKMFNVILYNTKTKRSKNLYIAPRQLKRLLKEMREKDKVRIERQYKLPL